MRERSKSRQPARVTPALSQVSTALLFFLIVLPCFSQSQESWQSPPRPNNQGDNQETIKINVDLVVLHATVQNRKGIPVSGLGKEDFQVYEDGVLQEIESFSHEDIPVTIGIVIDNSGSMRPKRTEVIAAALAFARASNAKDQFFVINFNEHVSFGLPANTPFTDERAQLEFALSRVAPNGLTALYDAVAAALDHLKKGNRDKRALIVISDGADNASRHNNLARIMALAMQSEVIIYTIGLYDRDNPDRNIGSLKQFAKATGGEAFLPESVKDVVPICERIARDIRNQYTITYVPKDIKYDGKYRVIQVKAGAPGRGRLMVRARAGYYAPLKP
jgi:Ca-activated chloride channel family protein